MTKKCRSKLELLGVVPNAWVNLTNGKFIAMVIEINMVDGYVGWWIDTCVSRCVCYDRVMFKHTRILKIRKCCWEMARP